MTKEGEEIAVVTTTNDEAVVGLEDDSSTVIDALAYSKEMQCIRKDFYIPPHPDEIPLEPGQRLVVLGDIHGRFDLLLTCLGESGIIDQEKRWIAGNTVCVQVGDILDRGYAEEKCIRLLCRLAQESIEQGGALVILWGNHEVCNAEHKFSCTENETEFEETFGSVLDKNDKTWRDKYGHHYAARSAAMEPGGLLAEPFLSKLKVSVKVGRTVIVHGGLTVDHLERYDGSLAKMNKAATDWILTGKDAPECFMLFNGPVWIRDYSNVRFSDTSRKVAEMVVAEMADAVLAQLDVDRMVVGHTVQPDGVNSVLDEKVWRVDVGDGYNNRDTTPWKRPSVIEDDQRVYAVALEVTQGTEPAAGEQTKIVSRQKYWGYWCQQLERAT